VSYKGMNYNSIYKLVLTNNVYLHKYEILIKEDKYVSLKFTFDVKLTILEYLAIPLL